MFQSPPFHSIPELETSRLHCDAPQPRSILPSLPEQKPNKDICCKYPTPTCKSPKIIEKKERESKREKSYPLAPIAPEEEKPPPPSQPRLSNNTPHSQPSPRTST